MHVNSIKDQIIDSIGAAQKGQLKEANLYSTPDPDADTRLNELLFFIKPEITSPSPTKVDYSEILTMTFEQFRRFDVGVREIKLLSAAFLDERHIMAGHYGTINKLAHQGEAAMTDATRQNFRDVYGISTQDANVLGAFPFMEKFGIRSAEELDRVWKETPHNKIGSGTYCAPMSMNGDGTVYLINGFHPLQLEKYIKPGASIVTFRIVTDTDWDIMRRDFVGATDPSQAEPNSLRRTVFEAKQDLGLSNISLGDNGFHLSAGPFEGLVELRRFTGAPESEKTDILKHFKLGRALLERYDPETIEALLSNVKIIYNGRQKPVFDHTEEMNTDAALRLVANSCKRQGPKPIILSPI